MASYPTATISCQAALLSHKKEKTMGKEHEEVVETTETTTKSVPEHEVAREEKRLSGEPDHVVEETTKTETTERR
jgi:hypothetical protein